MPKKGSSVEQANVVGLTPSGEARAIAYDDGLYDLFLDPRFAAPGDRLTVRLLGKRQGRWQAQVQSVEEPSPARRTPPCPQFGLCGGCSLQHLPYADQVAQKAGMVRQCLDGLAPEAAWLPDLAAPAEFGFRNKMEFTASARPFLRQAGDEPPPGPGALGLFVPYSGNKVLDIERCLLQPDAGNRILAWVRRWIADRGLSYYHSGRHEGYLRTVLLRSNLQGEFLAMPIVAEDRPETTRQLCADLAAAFGEIRSIWSLVNPKLNDSYADLAPVHELGERCIEERLGRWRFSVGPQTFLQVNSAQSAALYDRILDLAAPRATDTVYDLYCGVGTISLWLSPACAAVVGVECVEPAVAAARAAAQANGVANASFHAGDMKDLLSADFFAAHGKPDLVVTDPPRAGMHPKALRALADCGARRIVYVSCNPSSLARDLAVLGERYKPTAVQVVDLMPQTLHVETICVLEAR